MINIKPREELRGIHKDHEDQGRANELIVALCSFRAPVLLDFLLAFPWARRQYITPPYVGGLIQAFPCSS